MVHPFPAPLDFALIGQFAQHALECGTVGVFGAEGACDLARADFAGVLANEGEKLLAGRKGAGFGAGWGFGA